MKAKTFAAILFLFAGLAGCMSITVHAREGSTVTIHQDKPVTTTTDAQVPVGAM